MLEGGFFVSAVQNLSPEYIYIASGELAYWVFGALTFPILFLALIWRVRGEVLSAVTGKGAMWLSIMTQFVLWGLVLTLYFAICQLIFDGFNVLYSFSETLGGHQAIMGKFTEYYDQAVAMTDAEQKNWKDSILNLASMPVTGLMMVIYNITMLVYVAAHIFARWAQAIGFATAFYWGLIAIPLSLISENNKKFLQNWMLLLTTMLLWPCIDGATQWMVSHGFLSMFETLNQTMQQSNQVYVDLPSIYSLFSLLNIVLTLTILVAFGLTVALVVSGTVSALNSMAVGGGLAVGGLALSSISKGVPVFGRNAAGIVESASHKAPASLSSVVAATKNSSRGLLDYRERVQTGVTSKANSKEAVKANTQTEFKTTHAPKQNPVMASIQSKEGKSIKPMNESFQKENLTEKNNPSIKRSPRKPLTQKQKRDRKNAIIRQLKAQQDS